MASLHFDRRAEDEPVSKLTVAVILTLIFALLTISHIVATVMTRTAFGICMLLGGLFDTVGLIAQSCSDDYIKGDMATKLGQVFPFLAPVLFAAGNHLFFVRYLRKTALHGYACVPPDFVIVVTGGCDILYFIIQAVGVGKLANAVTPAAFDTARIIILTGLGLQIVCDGFFIIASVIFHSRVSSFYSLNNTFPHTRAQMWGVHLCSFIIMVRTIARVLEAAFSNSNVHILDIFLMSLVLFLTLTWYPKFGFCSRRRANNDFQFPLANFQAG
ncbi:hypothetical protein N7532_000671 [Penicillium argentinense]|uniref:Uncharacterized protein n=1 Tax=Penicillium argentinense TaxID=1131581 RepID=A0A9W9G5W8_9EURO|nr:uncharacterized protein N7532_000671 [Penicillium argentinense]KAJ5112626.1 hypothetical protein N7532_000671 [Penicillium argentinense]